MNPFRLLLITDDSGRSAGQMRAIISEALDGGVTAVQLREKRASARQIASLIRKLLPLCRSRGVPFLLNGSLLSRLEVPAELDGLHFGKGSLLAEAGLGPCIADEEAGSEQALPAGLSFRELAQSALGPDHSRQRRIWAGYSAHSVREAQSALARGADYVTLSPIFPTPSKEGLLEAIGTGPVAAARALLPGRWLIGLGGIDQTNAAEVIRAGADGVAVIRAIMSSTHPKEAARALRQAIDRSLEEEARPGA